MVCHPFAKIRNARMPLTAIVFLVAVSAAFLCSGEDLLSADQPPSKAKDKVVFEGKWDGKYENDQRETGQGKYEFHKEKDGRFEVTVSWDMDTKKMQLEGERLGPDAIRLEGEYKGITYWYIGRKEGSGLVLRYLSVEGKTGNSGTGVSKLTRQK